MKERINRQTDENLYQPKIHSERIRALYELKVITRLPMTVLVDMAIRDFLERNVAEQGIIYSVREEREPQQVQNIDQLQGEHIDHMGGEEKLPHDL